jgi:PAS domain S-box-containing protein
MKTKLKILIVEDSSADVELLKIELQNQQVDFIDILVQTEQDYLKGIEQFDPDIILSDFHLPGFNALRALSLLKELNKDIPFILVTGTQSEEIAVQCIKDGASDYILKSSLIRLPSAVRLAMEAKQSKDAFRKAEAEYKELIESINDVIFSADVTGKITYISPVITMLTGHDPSELMNYAYKKLIYEEDIPHINTFLSSDFTNKNKTLEFRIRSKEGELKWIKISARPNYERNKLAGFRGIISDITTKKLSEIELLKAKEKAEELVEMKTNFLANISHELRTPMVGILGFSEMMESELMTSDADLSEICSMASMIKSSGKRFMETLNLILEFSALERGGEGLHLSGFNFNEVSKFIYRIHQPAAAKKNIHFDLKLPSLPAMVYLDEKFCRSILNNLISNAVKFTHENGFVVVSVEVKNVMDKEWLVLMVKDNGIGIPAEKKSAIFEEFRQLSSGYSRNFEGTGLGLTITDKYVKKLNGTIEVESEVGHGSTFIVKLPLSSNIKPEGHIEIEAAGNTSY